MNWWRFYSDLRDMQFQNDRRLRRLERTERNIMAQLEDVKAQVSALVAEDSIVIAALQDLRARVNAGQQVTAADLDDLQSSIQSEVARLNDAVNSVADPVDDTSTDQPTDQPPTDQPPTDTAPVDDTPGDALPTSV